MTYRLTTYWRCVISTDNQDFLPLTETTFFILLSLAQAPRHGYAIMKDVETLSDDRISLGTGTLYGALGRLLDQGWIERSDSDEPRNSDRPRKRYALTDTGRRLLAAEISRLESVVAAARLRIAGGMS